MMGNDCERIILNINILKNNLHDLLNELSTLMIIPIMMEPYEINHVDGTIETIYLVEKEINVPFNIFNDVITSLNELSSDFIKMDKLKENLYTNSTKFNNSNGSPWTELELLKTSVDKILSLANNGINYTSEILKIMTFINNAISCAVDAKQSFVLYHDYIQRGYDKNYNDNKPSIQFLSGYEIKTIGNVRQEYSENVNIEKESIDPF